MIIVCDNTDIAEVFYREISGEESVEVIEDIEDEGDDEEVTLKKKKKPKRKTTYGTGKIFPEYFSNKEGLTQP
jgi:type III restriction enzyme